ncbi:MAG: hypothetical protein CK531_08825 [Gemmatimonadetes bacterium]|nr:MAG: hypothetical protein CK531_09865 [Gemmatimonadota bacterium]PHX96417.1 MAG: hypothetical protein CK531_08825 [Gemmatimonadota bacterium]
MAAAVRDTYPDAEIEMMSSGGGRFEVSVDSRPVFQKSNLGRHARPGELLALITAVAPRN